MRPALRKLPKSFDKYPMPQMLVRTTKRTDSNFAMARLMNIGGVQKKPRVDFARLRQILSGQPDRSVNRDLGEFSNRHGRDADFVQRSDSVCHRRCPFEPALALLMPHSALNGRRDQTHR